MHADEARDAGALLGHALDELTQLVRDVHRAVSARLFDLLGARADPVRLLHDGVASVGYGATRLGVRAIPAAAGLAVAALHNPATSSLHDGPRGRFALNALNGFWGDRIAMQRTALATELRIRTHDGPLRRLPANVVHDVAGTATGRLIVFVHGLCANDLSWSWGSARRWGEPGITYGSLLRDTAGWTPLYVSYNSGLHVSANGRELADQLEELTGRWPVPVTEIALVGHSMGGLVVRSAAHQAAQSSQDWVGLVRQLIGLGTPHLGAPLERAVSKGTRLLARAPETRPFAKWLNRRSVGIKDLRYGAVVEDDWAGFDPDDVVDDRCMPGSFLAGINYCAASATFSRRPTGWLAHDLLVQHASATGNGPLRRLPFEAHRSFHLARKHHFDLLGDPLLYEQLCTWLGAPTALPG